MIPLGAGSLLEYRVTDAMWVCAGVVRVARSFFCLTDPDPPPRWHWQANTRDNGLVGVTEGALLVRTGCGGGWANLTVELHVERPAAETAGWDDAVEISYRTAVGQSHVRSARGGGTDFPGSASAGRAATGSGCTPGAGTPAWAGPSPTGRRTTCCRSGRHRWGVPRSSGRPTDDHAVLAVPLTGRAGGPGGGARVRSGGTATVGR
ncbi:hypothetical protein [Plantactinospora veratri]